MRCNVCLFLEEVCLLPAEVLVPQAAADLFCSGPNQETSQTDAQPQNQPQRLALSRFIPEKHVSIQLDPERGAELRRHDTAESIGSEPNQ